MGAGEGMEPQKTQWIQWIDQTPDFLYGAILTNVSQSASNRSNKTK